MDAPSLCEPGMKYFLKGSLKECKKFRDSHSTLLFNLGAFILLCIGFCGLLWYRYKGKPSPEEIKQKQRETHSYLISKLQQYTAARQKSNPNMITDLPVWDRKIA